MMPAPAYQPRNRTRQPTALAPAYKSSAFRAPQAPPLSLPVSRSEDSGPVFRQHDLGPLDGDLIHNAAAPGAAAIGSRIIVHGRVIDEFGRGIPHTLVEVWQANSSGRYRHQRDNYCAALDPNFAGCGRVLTDQKGHYRFITIKPGAYPWRNTMNDWRPAHIHFSLFGEAFAQRLITQMYFEGDPLIDRCPIVQTIPCQDAIDRLTATLDMSHSLPLDSLAYRFDIVLRGRRQTLFDNRPEGL